MKCRSVRSPLPEPTATVRPSGANCIACSRTGRPSRTGGPDGFQVRRSVKRTTPSRSPDASSRPSGLIAAAATSTVRQPAGHQQAGVALQHRQQLPARLHAVLQLDGGDAVEHRQPEVLRGLRERPDALGVVALQRGEQVSAGLDAVLDLDRGGRVEHRLREGRGGARQRADALRVRGQRLRLGGALGVLGGVARDDGEHAAQDGDDEEHGRARQQGPEAAVRPSLGAALAVGLLGSGVEERALGGVELGPPGLDELERGGEPGAAVEVGGLAAAGVPEPRGVSELLVRADPGAVLVEPAAQLRPLADQRLVRDLGRAVVERDEALLGEPAAGAPRRTLRRRPPARARRRPRAGASPRCPRRARSCGPGRRGPAGAARRAARRRAASAVRPMAEATPPVSR